MDEKKLIEELLDSISPKESLRIEKRMLLAAKIGDAMKAKGWKKKDLLLAMGKKNQSEITRWLSGTHNFTCDLLTDLGTVLDTDFLNLEKPEPKPVIYTISVTVNSEILQSDYANEITTSKRYLQKKISA